MINAALAALCLASWSSRLTATPREADRVWVGPMPFVADRTLRADYARTILNSGKWREVLGQTDVLKTYIMVLPADPVAGKPEPEMPDDTMKALARFVKAHKLKFAVEVGGVRMADETPVDRAGQLTAAGELTHLRRWVRCGGQIDYLTTDHGVMIPVGSPYVSPANYKSRGMTIEQGIDQLVDYFAIVHRELPRAKLGAIESLGFFEVGPKSGRHYSRTVPALPVWPFEEFIDRLKDKMAARGLTLDHFHIDFGYEGVRHDGGGQGRLDFGRILAVEAALHARGIKAGVIVNAFHDQSAQNVARAEANREAFDRTVAFLDGYRAAGGAADHIVLQTWQPYPDRTGPEDEPHTVLNLSRELLRHGAAKPRQ